MTSATMPQTFDEWTTWIDHAVKAHKVVMFAKGEKGAPQCGFSNRAMQILDACNVPYEVHNVLAAPGMREALVKYSNWPTTPQVFVDGRLIGGCDIVTEMFQNGDLKKILDETLKVN